MYISAYTVTALILKPVHFYLSYNVFPCQYLDISSYYKYNEFKGNRNLWRVNNGIYKQGKNY